RNLIEYLLERTNKNITVLDNLSEGKIEYLKSISNYSEKRIKFIQGDIRNKDDVKKAMKGCDHVIHLAAQTDVIDSVKDPRKDADINILGTINLLEEAVEEDVDRFVQASSAAPLGEQEMPIHEEKDPQPLAPYGASKLACEGYCSAFAGSYSLPTVALRFSNVYGPKSWHKGSVVAKFIKQILDGETPTIFGDGGQTRDFIHTKDISQALHLSCTERMEEGFQLFQIGTGEETSINELYSKLKTKLEDEGIQVPEPDHGEKREGEIYRNYTDISKAKKELNYEPKIDLDRGLDETIDWFLNDYKSFQ
ncbi:MAG: GDP-mannose 4,6-dehydratase, partial [Candidatus Thermoplasmatota archaeon]|nr:GDP-mannose 4,6-dehydratase [Candidatus Thermoplasmatota archaeon]